jgi:sugar/nucleoside kinase (ribokinase family)
MKINIPPKKCRYDLLSIGGWTIYDHIFNMKNYPRPGETVELLPDSNVNQVYWGDCVFNVAAAAGALGLKTAVLTVAGNDFFSSGYPEALEKLGVDTGHVQVEPDHPSGHSYLFSDPVGEGFCLSWRGASMCQPFFTPQEEPLRQTKIVVLNEAFDIFTLKGAQIAAESGAYIISNGMLGTAEASLRMDYFKCIDLLCISAAEARMLLEALSVESEEAIFNFGPQAVIVTHGAEGSEVITREGRIHVAAVLARKVVDVTGAGDSFVGGVATGLARGFELPRAARLGAGISSFVIEAMGCQTNLPTWDQVYTRAFTSEEDMTWMKKCN